MSTSLLLQQCPACLVCLTLIVFVMGGKWPYSCCFMGCCLQDLCEGNVPGHSKRARTCLACRRETDMAAASIFDEGRSRTSER